MSAQERDDLRRTVPRVTRRKGKFITTPRGRLVNFASNDSLGLGTSKRMRTLAGNAFGHHPPSASASRLAAGDSAAVTSAEQKLARFFGYESALLFPSGFQANAGLLAALLDPGDRVVADRSIHASMVWGLRQSGARLSVFRHNDMDHLHARTAREGASVAVMESLYSMDGDLLPVSRLQDLRKRKDLFCIVDEAHALGVLGEGGRGIAAEVADVTVGTLGKAFGLFGAFVLLPEHLREYLLGTAAAQIYTTAPAPAHGALIAAVLDLIARADARRTRLAQVSEMMRSALSRAGFVVSGEAHILAVHVGREDLAVRMARDLQRAGFLVLAARHPTVPRGRAILRLGMSALHTRRDVTGLAAAMTRAMEENQ
jgi:8-amino-7-oxononanoate synthase